MKISRLALKKLDCMFGHCDFQRQKRFEYTYLYSSINKLIPSIGLSLQEVEAYCRKCEEFDILILGLETPYESSYGLHTYIFEEYNEPYQPGWWYYALAQLQSKSIIDNIIPHIEISEDVLKKYSC